VRDGPAKSPDAKSQNGMLSGLKVVTLCDTQGVVNARSTEKAMETEDKNSMGRRGKAASQGAKSYDSSGYHARDRRCQ